MKAKYIINRRANEYKAYNERNTYYNNTESIKESYSDLIKGKIDKVSTFNYDDAVKPYQIILEGEIEIERIGANLIIKPFLNLAILNNKLIQDKRTYPVDFVYPNRDEFDININIPKGFKFTENIKPYETDNKLVSIKLKYQVSEGVLNIKGEYSFKKSIYTPEEYLYIKSCMHIIVKRFNKEIVFEETLN